MRRKKISFTTRYVLAFGILLLVANILLGIVILQQSEAAMRSLINKNMLDIAKSAAGLLDGDALGALTEEDVDGEVFNDVKDKLNVFQKNVDIQFIYAVRQIDEETFVFTVDPDPVAPAEFGEEIVVTEGIKQAGRGIGAVDSEPMADQWGNFYSAYSPVFDSEGRVAGIVGLDFDAEWYNEQVRKHTIIITVVTVLSVLIGVVMVFIITNNVRKRFKKLDAGLSTLSSGMDQLMEQVGTNSRSERIGEAEDTSDEIEVLGRKVQTMQRDMAAYLHYLQKQAYSDALTHVGSSTAYHERIQQLDREIAAGGAAFSVVVFDVNRLKEINDSVGHEYGDEMIAGAAECIASVFGPQRTYRIGGDEFAVIKKTVEEAELVAVDVHIAAYNRKHETRAPLVVSKGTAHYRPGEDPSFKEVFARADMRMYDEKKHYYETTGDRRRR